MKKIIAIFLCMLFTRMVGDCTLYNDTQDDIWVVHNDGKEVTHIIGGPPSPSLRLEKRKMLKVETPFTVQSKDPDRYADYPASRLPVPDIFEVDDIFCIKYSRRVNGTKKLKALKFTTVRNVISTAVPEEDKIRIKGKERGK